jgi:hypothetical protein
MKQEKEKLQRQLHLGVVLNPTIKVWRYMDLPKFMYLLEKEALFFCRADLFADEFEGSFTKPAIEFREKVWRETMPGVPEEHFEQFLDFHSFHKRQERENFFLNCWHKSEYESAAMWEIYGIKNQTIAIQSSYNLLRECLPEKTSESGQPLEGHVDIGLVQYLDYGSDPMPQIYSFDPFLRKRKSFAHEQEIRLFYQAPTQEGSYQKESKEYKFIPKSGLHIENPKGIDFRIEVNRLVEKVFVAPSSPSWYFGLIKSICIKYGFFKTVEHSGMEGTPLY